MQPVRVYKRFLPSTPSRRVGPCGLHVFFEWAYSLADNGYAKSEDPMGHVLVSSPPHLFLSHTMEECLFSFLFSSFFGIKQYGR
jgi:hypothetical protein